MPTASEITVQETLVLLDTDFASVAKAICDGGYAFWLGSGISREKVIGLDGVLAKLLTFLQERAAADPGGKYETALSSIIDRASLSAEERAKINLGQPTSEWVDFKSLIAKLWNSYSVVLATEIDGERADHLLWDGLDFAATFTAQDPDAEHLAIAVLALEGAVSEIATTNWDGLIEAAMTAVGWPNEVFRITVTGDDIREPAKPTAMLYKFHGCAKRAVEDEGQYRDLLVARSGQIVKWTANDTFKIARDQLCALIQKARTLVIGLSAQDANIKAMFAKVGAHTAWKWDSAPTPIVIAAEALGADQRELLEVAYGEDYDPNRNAIQASARLRAYAKPLLTALVLKVLAEKLKLMTADVTAPGLDDAARTSLSGGIDHLRDLAALAGDADRTALMKAIVGAVSRTRYQLSDGISAVGVPKYYPIDTLPAAQMKGKQALAASGQREASMALGLIGLDVGGGEWEVTLDDPASAQCSALHLKSDSSHARVFLAANDDAISELLSAQAFQDTDEDVVVICSKRVTPPQQRSPGGSFRDGTGGPRYVALGPMLAESRNLDDLQDAFRKGVAV